jgi:tyrosyl-tRNA synthetase
LRNNIINAIKQYITVAPDVKYNQISEDTINGIVEEEYNFISLNASNMYSQLFNADKSKDEIELLEREHAEAPHLRLLQKRLAAEVTTMVHSEADLNQAIEASAILFGQGSTDQLKHMPEELFLTVFEGVPQCSISKQLLFEDDITTVLSQHTGGIIFPSKGEARKMISAGGVGLNKTKVEQPDSKIGEADLLNGKYLLVQKGKKNYFLILAQ